MQLLIDSEAILRPRSAPSSITISPPRPPSNALQRSRLLTRIAALTCSASWTSTVFAAAETARIDFSNTSVARALRDQGIYPPPADTGQHDLPRKRPVRMRRCDACGRIVPPNNLAEHKLIRVCDDCRCEPDRDESDDRHDEARVARAPGAQFRLLVKGSIDEATPRQLARQRLTELGLSDQEITVLAFLVAGYSSRQIGSLIERSQTFVRKLQRSAERKVRRSGLAAGTLKFPRKLIPEKRVRSVDPVKLDAVANWGL